MADRYKQKIDSAKLHYGKDFYKLLSSDRQLRSWLTEIEQSRDMCYISRDFFTLQQFDIYINMVIEYYSSCI